MPDFENFDPENKKLLQKINWAITPSLFDLENFFILFNPPKLAKIIRVFKVNFFSKLKFSIF